jgi:hypothetical protein
MLLLSCFTLLGVVDDDGSDAAGAKALLNPPFLKPPPPFFTPDSIFTGLMLMSPDFSLSRCSP